MAEQGSCLTPGPHQMHPHQAGPVATTSFTIEPLILQVVLLDPSTPAAELPLGDDIGSVRDDSPH
jgi:hypothetical protein